MLTIFTIVLNGMPFMPRQYEIFQKLGIPWQWRIVEGVANPTHCTSWCKKVPDKWHKNGLSIDGTTEFCEQIQDERVRHIKMPFADGKISMIHAALEGVKDGVVMQVDCDEIWDYHNIGYIYSLLLPNFIGHMAEFRCDYWVGPHHRIVRKPNCYGDNWYEWRRAWTWGEAMQFSKHEPPETYIEKGKLAKYITSNVGLVFQHYAYTFRHQVEFKADYYGYGPEAIEGWERLQETRQPVYLRDYFPWVKDGAIVEYVGNG